MQEQIIDIVALVFNIEPSQLNGESNLTSVPEWDSMNHMKLILALEEEFDCKIDDDQAIELLSIKDICNYFQA